MFVALGGISKLIMNTSSVNIRGESIGMGVGCLVDLTTKSV
jgi:hypothetical protein